MAELFYILEFRKYVHSNCNPCYYHYPHNYIQTISYEEIEAIMITVIQVFTIAISNFNGWLKNPKVIITFALSFIECFLLTTKVISFANVRGSSLQITETFICTFNDSDAVLLSTMFLIILFADMPFLSSFTTMYLVRTSRTVWVIGQLVYCAMATSIFILFVLLSTVLLSMTSSYPANMWSSTAAILGFSKSGNLYSLPLSVRMLEMSWPYQTTVCIFSLLLGYALTLTSVMFFFNLWKGKIAGVISTFAFSLYGFLLKPDTIQRVFALPDEAYYKANVALGWISPLNHATYHMHNFGYDLLPKLWQSFLAFAVCILIGVYCTIRVSSRYNFCFSET